MSSLRLCGICGSLRGQSINRKLLQEAVRQFGPADYIEADLRMPLYDGDVEDSDGIPAAAQVMADQIAAADAVIVVTPEYNQSISGVLKNALDWVSRTKGAPWRHKPVALMSAAAGRTGGARAQYALRLCLTPFRPLIVPGPEVLIAGAGSAFDDAGNLTNERYLAALTEHMQLLRATASTTPMDAS